MLILRTREAVSYMRWITTKSLSLRPVDKYVYVAEYDTFCGYVPGLPFRCEPVRSVLYRITYSMSQNYNGINSLLHSCQC
ncbi:hypothetical protein Plhal304r1_c006g0025461 [Plasmopara halstedii]